MNCKNCGFRHDGDDSFCRKCGVPIEAPVINHVINVVRVPVTTVEKQTKKKSGATEIIETFLQVVFAFLATISSFVLLMTLFFDWSILPSVLFLMFLPNAIILLMLFRKTVPILQRSRKRYYVIAVIIFCIIGIILFPDSSQVPMNTETPVDTQTTSAYSMQSTQSEQATTEILTANQETDAETVVEIPEPSPLPTETQPTVADKGDTITLVYGELGEYGKTVTIDGKDYIWFAVPSGKYLVKSKVPSCTIFVNKDEIKKNAEGYGETQIVIMLPITADDEPKEIYVGEDEHIFITISATVEITPVK